MNDKFNIIGKKIPRQDAYAKLTGSAKFGDDYVFPGMLYGVMIRTGETHAEINKIDYSGVLNSPAVVTVCDASDIKGARKTGAGIRHDQPVFAYHKVVTPGDVVAMLVGENEEELLGLKDKVKFECTPLPVITDPLKALDEESPLIHGEYGSNLIIHYPLIKGDIEKGFSESENIIEQTYRTQFIEHSYIEPEVVIAVPLEGNRGVKIIGSIQNPHSARKVVASVLDLPLTHVRIIQAELGGSFGGKDDTMCILSARAAIAALKTNHPVKIRYNREESILESYKRHPYIMKYKAGYNNDGKILAMKIDIIADGGAYASMSPFVTWRTVVQATGPYEIPNVRTDVKAVYTNNPYTGAMRGFGSPQPIFAQESLMDEIASRLYISPYHIRKINGFKNGSVTASGQVLKDHDVNLFKVLDTAALKSSFETKYFDYKKNSSVSLPYCEKEFNKDSIILNDEDFISSQNSIRKGIGLALSYRGCSLGAEGIDAAAAYISLQNDGSCYLLCGLAENGQGLKTTFSIIAAEVLGINPSDIYYLDHDTSMIPDSGPTVASRSTLMGGSAVRDAAMKIRKQLELHLIKEWNLSDNAEFEFRDGIVSSSDKSISFSELAMSAYKKGICLAALGWYKGPDVHWDENTGQGSAYFTYVYGCQVAEVSVNLLTGEVKVDKIYAVHDAGKIINQLGAEGQVFGGVTQGAGYGILEELTTDNGKIRELNFDQYLIPTSMDIGEIVPVFIEGKDIYGAWGAKSLGEPTLELTAAALANAITNATGKRFFSLPINLEEIICKRKLYPKSAKRGSA